MSTEKMAMATTDLDLPISNLDEAGLAKLTERRFLPFVKLLGTSSKEVEDGTIKPGTYILQRDQSSKLELTGSFEALVIASRSLACRKTTTGVLRYYDIKSPEYAKIEAESQIKGQMGCWHGPEFLIWVRAHQQWATFHASSATAQGRAVELFTILKNWQAARQAKKAAIEAGQPGAADIVVPNPQVTFKSGKVTYNSNGKTQWAPTFAPCTTPFSQVPPFEEVRAQTLKFVNPPKSEQETVEAGEGAQPTGRG